MDAEGKNENVVSGSTETDSSGQILSVLTNSTKASEEYTVETEIRTVEITGVSAELILSVVNTSSEQITISSSTISPFGILTLQGEDVENNLLLWNDKYETSSQIQTNGTAIEFRTSRTVSETISPGESITSTYTLRQDISFEGGTNQLQSGTYQLWGYDGEHFTVDDTAPEIKFQINAAD